MSKRRSKKRKKWNQKLHELIKDQIADEKSGGVLAHRSKPSDRTLYKAGKKLLNGGDIPPPMPTAARHRSPKSNRKHPPIPRAPRSLRGLPQESLDEIERLYQQRLARRKVRESG